MLCIVPADKADAAGLPDSLLKRDLTRFLVRSKSKYDVMCVCGVGVATFCARVCRMCQLIRGVLM